MFVRAFRFVCLFAFVWLSLSTPALLSISACCEAKRVHFVNNFLLIGDPDYKLKCIGFWKENLRSYLITYDELDAFSRYRCWVYQRADLTKIYMSQALGPYCPLNQDVTSWNYTEGAAVFLNMEEYERERKS